MLTVIIPTYQAEAGLRRLMTQLGTTSVIVSDGGSEDETLNIAVNSNARLALGAKGRGQQLALGAKLAQMAGHKDDWFLFLHADSDLPDHWRDVVEIAMRGRDPRYFRFKANAAGLKARMMNRMVALRCWALGLPYGDQGLLISRQLYEDVGGYRNMALFEDVDIVERLHKISRLRPLKAHLKTDVSQHWDHGLWRRGLRNLGLLWRYKRGASVESLSQGYTS